MDTPSNNEAIAEVSTPNVVSYVSNAISSPATSVETPKATAAPVSASSSSPQPVSTPLNSLPGTSTVASPGGANNSQRNNNGSTPRTNLRGLNKPKCSVCGNVARSRCPYQACKSCCVKAKNPCQIHVLKQNAGYPEKSPSQSSALFDQPRSTAVTNSFSPSVSTRPFSTPVLHHPHPYFPGSLAQMKVKRPLSRKDILAINNWRFKRLKDFVDGKIEAEDEAFERYMTNVSMLEDVFCSTKAGSLYDESATTGDDVLNDTNTENYEDDMLVNCLKLRLNSNIERQEMHKQELKTIFERGVHRLKCKNADEEDANSPISISDSSSVTNTKSIRRDQLKRLATVNTLLDKLGKARNQEDVHTCFNLYKQIVGKTLPVIQSVKKADFIEAQTLQSTESKYYGPSETPANMKVHEDGEQNGLSHEPFPVIYSKGWAEVKLSDEKIQHVHQSTSIMNDVLQL